MGKIGEFEKTVVAEPLKEPLPEKIPMKSKIPANRSTAGRKV